MILFLIFIIFIILLLSMIPAPPVDDNRQFFYYNYDEIINNVSGVKIIYVEDNFLGGTLNRYFYSLAEENIDDFLMDLCTIKFYINDEESDRMLYGMYIYIIYENDESLIIHNRYSKFTNTYCSTEDYDYLLTKYYYLRYHKLDGI